MSDLVDRLIAMKPRSYGPAGLFDLLGDAAAEITDLTKANGILHGIVSNREEEISDLRAQLEEAKANAEHGWTAAGAAADTIYDLRAQLASAQEQLTMVDGTLALERSGLGIDTHATMVELCRKFAARQIELEARLASARKALEAALPIVSDRCAGGRMITPREDASKAFYLIQSALSDEKGES